MVSVVNYPERGNDGRNTYRGNCSGKLIEDCINQWHVKEICDYMVGSGTTEDVAKRMGITSHCYDLNRGFDVLTMDLPERSEFTFWHPPYHDMVVYSGKQYSADDVITKYGFDPRLSDLSRCKDWEEFVERMNYCCMKMFNALEKGGRLAILMGDYKKKGKLYSMLTDIVKPGTMENIIIKMQNNCMSDSKTYTNQNFVPIIHEYLLVLRKDNPLIFELRMTKTSKADVRDMGPAATWRDVVYGVLHEAGHEMTLSDIYDAVDGHRKAERNPHWREKIRQTLQMYPDFQQVERGVWDCAA